MFHLKKLLRYAIGLLAIALLFNILGYVYISYQSRENDRQEENEKIAGNLQTLSQQVAKDMLFMLVDQSHQLRSLGLNDELQATLLDLEEKQAFLRQEIYRPRARTSDALQGLSKLYSQIAPFYTRLDSLAHKVLQDTATTMATQDPDLPARIRYNESQYLGGMQDITRIYRNLDNGFVNKI